MRYNTLTIFLALSLLSSCAQYFKQPMRTTEARLGAESAQYKTLVTLPPPQEPIVAAVYKFRDQTGQYKEQELGTSWSTAVTQGATSILLRALEESNWFVPIEREGLNNLLNERKIIRSSRASYNDQGNATEPLLPPLLFGGIILEGGIISFDSNVMTGGAGVRYFGTGASGQYRVDRVTIYLRAISTSNGRILKTVYTSKMILSQEVEIGIFRFVDFQRLLEAETGFTYNEPGEMAVREAIEKAVISLILEGAMEGIWNFADASAINDPVVENYLKERDEKDLIDMFGNKHRVRRSFFSAGLNLAGWYYLGDLGGSRWFPAGELDLEFWANNPVSLQFTMGYGNIGTTQNYQGQYALAELSGNYRWFNDIRSTPYLRIGFGALGEISNNQEADLEPLSNIYPYFLGELGYEYLINDKLSINGAATYRQTFSDEVDKVVNGVHNDAIWGGRLGVKYFFQFNKKNKQ
jgi:curli production assembly/transport component CsgG